MVEKFLELGCFAALMCSKIGFTAHIDRREKKDDVSFRLGATCTQGRQVVELDESIVREALAQVFGQRPSAAPTSPAKASAAPYCTFRAVARSERGRDALTRFSSVSK